MARCNVCVVALAAVLLLVFAIVSRSNGLKGREFQGASRIPSEFSEEELVAMKEALKGAIQIPTVSFSHEESNFTALAEFGEYIHKVFPAVFNTSFIRHEVVGNYSHLFTIQGSEPSLQPYMLMAHFDVVPAHEEGWEVPPFSGLERDGFIHGRGTLDNKNSVMAILQALELLLTRNYKPRRSFFITLGHDEEVSGTNGAQKMSALLQARGVQLAFIVDECGFILDGFIPNLQKPFAMISISEKGAIDLMLQVNMTPGHSSVPPKETSIGILSAALSRLEQTPMPNMFKSGLLKTTLQQLASEFSFPTNIVLSNLWLFGPLVSRILERNDVTNALIRTTTALTMYNAGVKVNVIPPVAKATVNIRIHPAQTVVEVLELIKNIVADDRVQFHVLRAFDPLPISPINDQALGYQMLHQTIQSVFPEVNIVTPGTCIGNTDSRHYTNLTTGIYLFNPVYLQLQDFRSIHGINEKISVQGYQTQVKFIFELIQNSDTDRKPVPHLHEL
ncbi:N-fatty-acyl-amino acid synthase/hydrolase PM20D1 isoform X2 [Marmota monax]|uniref:N-fatty-acyl-amino acid synthase/hydrolase PM20D1 isoform X2 n=1 Tax=Marmota monax TaxID=9995 RepID=UPI001EB01C0B|nr:N-fatty-acyl-amino acid synthase/hydrolase PM20D1 isoform X2 [Marmota monax]KAI6051314.1 PM20D1 [Marmota monax]KAI6061834.1 PM20D1 [Marmota monax]